ncbi:radical sam alpha/beta horseshoe [Lucifera butyrica]|uniref:Radical sam alpha/beta horseshoe n=1 Tax=Lucifera butyrica TaxID=1351585 RepID=A0A498R1D5_9FIRM|nr:hypothetical protein [Lucifera butyrica]VBB05244.1 radical sam alpha/beta horseshoe [Lucifera butyrica]
MMKIGIVDADLLGHGTRHPNIALMKISAYKKAAGHTVQLVKSYEELGLDFTAGFFSPGEVIGLYDEIYLGKVFTFTPIPPGITAGKNVIYGGTGFLPEECPDLAYEVEHHRPDYHLYDDYVRQEIARGLKKNRFADYMEYSIGFATRGCFRKCAFCVNKKYDKVFFHAPVKEFFDPSRKYIYLWDDNILGYEKWRHVFDELEEIGRPFQFRQGMDMRLMTEERAAVISRARYRGDYIFAFDHLKDRELIENRLKIWKKYCTGTTKLYILCGFESQDAQDIEGVFERIAILMRYRCLPYIMRYDAYKTSEWRGIYINLARWCNQPNFFKKKSFREYCEVNGGGSSTMRYLQDFEKKYPRIARKYFDLKYEAAPICF